MLGDAETVTLQLGERDATFEIGDVGVTSRLIEGEFPKYQGLIPADHANRLVVDRGALLDAVRRVRLMAQEATPVRLVMSSDGLDLQAMTQDVGQAHESVDATYDGEANAAAGGTARGAETARGRTADAAATASATDDAMMTRVGWRSTRPLLR